MRLAIFLAFSLVCQCLFAQADLGTNPRRLDVPKTKLVAINVPSVDWREVKSVSNPVEDAAANAVKVVFHGPGFKHHGSGVYLGSKAVATCAHVPRETSGRGFVIFRDGTQIGCTVNGQDDSWDQAVLTLEHEHPTLDGVEIADADPRPGDRIYSAGFGQGFRLFGGEMVSVAGNGSGQMAWISHRGEAVQGDSGGPMFTETGRLIGCLWGSSTGQTVGTSTAQFRIFVRHLLPRLAQWRANRIAGVQQCPDGSCNTSQPPSYVASPTPSRPVTLNGPITSQGCPAGPIGATGPAGPQGEPGSVTEEQLQAIIAAVVDQIKSDPSMRGPSGERGPAGSAGSDASIDVSELATAVLARIPGQRVLLVNGNTKNVIDDETYKLGEPIVLDVNRFIRDATK